jgi:hypothetical protein
MTCMRLRLAAPIVALLAVLIMATPAWAGTVQIQDDARVLNATAVQNDAATLPVGVYIWATTQAAESKSVFDSDVRDKVNATFPIVIGINTQSARKRDCPNAPHWPWSPGRMERSCAPSRAATTTLRRLPPRWMSCVPDSPELIEAARRRGACTPRAQASARAYCWCWCW